jgi:hypothetical protein
VKRSVLVVFVVAAAWMAAPSMTDWSRGAMGSSTWIHLAPGVLLGISCVVSGAVRQPDRVLLTLTALLGAWNVAAHRAYIELGFRGGAAFGEVLAMMGGGLLALTTSVVLLLREPEAGAGL